MLAASFLHSSFLQAINAVMLWLVRVEKVPQDLEHLCPAKLQTRCAGMANSARPLAFATSNHFGRAQIAVALARMASSNF